MHITPNKITKVNVTGHRMASSMSNKLYMSSKPPTYCPQDPDLPKGFHFDTHRLQNPLA